MFPFAMSSEDRGNGKRNAGKNGGSHSPSAGSVPAAASGETGQPSTDPGPPQPATIPQSQPSLFPSEPVQTPQVVEPGARQPRPQRFLFISKWGLIHDLAWDVKKEGNEVLYHIMSKSDREVADGFVDKTITSAQSL